MTSSNSGKLLQSALAFHQSGELPKAAAIYARIRAVEPRNFAAVHLGGLVALQQGNAAEAATLLERACRLNRHSAPARLRLGIAFEMLHRFSESENSIRAALAIDPKAHEAWIQLGGALRKLGRLPEAEAALKQALVLGPDNADAHDRLGTLLIDLRGHAAAEPHFRRASELQPRGAPAWSNLGVCLLYLGRLGEALGAFARALSIDPRLDHAHAGKGLTLERCYQLSGAVESYDRALVGNPRNHQARSARLIALQYLGDRSRDHIFDEHRRFGAAVGGPPRREFAHSRDPERRLRIGFLSPDLHRHSVAYFIEPLLQHLDRSQFEIHLYHDQPVIDATSERLRSQAAGWRMVAGLGDDLLEGILRSDAPDILFDLAGHTGMNRLPLFARRLAPLQATYLGYPDTTGLPAMDYRLVDAITDPPGQAEAFCSEKLLRFAPTAWSYAPPSEAPDPSGPPSVQTGNVTFGCFNNFAKITDHALLAWGRLLENLPGSRLVLKGHGLSVPALQSAARRRLEATRISPERVEFLERTRTVEEHLAAYGRIDVALDTYPYHGTTTTCESLWMGVPVISLVGDRHASRVGASLLHAVGHPEWLARDWNDYIVKAAACAGDQAGRTALRLRLREEMLASVLLDHRGQAGRFGEALREIWRQHCRSRLQIEPGTAT